MSVPRISLSLSGEPLSFERHVHDQVTWSANSGIYMFCKPTTTGWQPVYIGKTVNFSQRPGTHERWQEARNLGATEVHAMVVATEAERARIEEALIGYFNPVLNTQHRLPQADPFGPFGMLGGLGGLRPAR